VAIASDRRRHPVAGLLEGVGARTVGIQAARSVARPDPAALREATARCLAAPCDELVVSSGLGLRAWIAAARRDQQAEPLVARLGQARLLARDPAAADALRALGLTTIFSTAGETTEELLRYLLARPSLPGRRVVVATDRPALSEACAELRHCGAEVIEVPTYTVSPPAESYSLRRLCDLVIGGQVDALALIGAPATRHLRDHASKERRLAALLAALRREVPCVALGTGTIAPLDGYGVPAVVAARPFAEEVAEQVLAALPRRGLRLAVNGHRLEVRGQAVVLDGRLIAVPGGPLTVLRALARDPGRVLSAAEIRRTAPTWADVDDHAVEMAVSRLRRVLRGADLVQTIVNRGYRLAT
jgi:uroporphyrinogen-III synthase